MKRLVEWDQIEVRVNGDKLNALVQSFRVPPLERLHLQFSNGQLRVTGTVKKFIAVPFSVDVNEIRASIHSYVENKGSAVETTADFLLLVPDVFILLWRLVNDPRVTGKDKILLGSAIAYFIFPFDLIPEAIVGPIGYLDDLVFSVY